MESSIIVAVIASLTAIVVAVLGTSHFWKQWRPATVAEKPANQPDITWTDAFSVAEGLLVKIEASEWKPEFVLGIGRSGAIWAGWLAGNLGSLSVAVVDVKYKETEEGRQVFFPVGRDILSAIRKASGEQLRILVIEGASSNGQTFHEFLRQMEDIVQGHEIRFAVLYKNVASSAHIDYVGIHGPPHWPERFPWHHRPAYRTYLKSPSAGLSKE